MIYDKAKQNHSGEKIARSSDQRWFGGFVIRSLNNVRGKLWRQSFISPLTLRILAVNIVALLIPIGFLFYSDFHRDGLINAELEVMSNKGKLIAAALGETSVGETHLGKQFINPIMARDIIRRLGDDPKLRTRLFVLNGDQIADSNQADIQVEPLPAKGETFFLWEWAFGLIDWGINWLPSNERLSHYREAAVPLAEHYHEVLSAFSGNIIGAIRMGGKSGLMLSVAVPVQNVRRVVGAIMLSQDATEIESAIRDFRQKAVIVSGTTLIITILLSVYLSGTIARPVLRLAGAAEMVRLGHGRESQQIPDFSSRGDEIGDLSRVLREMTDALHDRMDATERFAADVSHEIKNPLTSLRSAVETASKLKDTQQQKKLMGIILEDVQRLDRLITDISNASRLDSELSREEMQLVDLGNMISTLIDVENSVAGLVRFELTLQSRGCLEVVGLEDRLVQVFRNLFSNAKSFSPPDGVISVSAKKIGNFIEITIEDEGPGIPITSLSKIFDRFYTERPENEKFGVHSGLGLSISKQIIEAHRGKIVAENRYKAKDELTGARFIVTLPAE